MLALLGLVLAVFGAGLWWLGYTEDGLRWALARASAEQPRLAVEGARGALGRDVRIDRIAWKDEGLELELREVRARLDLLGVLFAGVRIPELQVQSLELRMLPTPDAPPPQSLGLPFRVNVLEAKVQSLGLQLQDRAHHIRDLHLAYAGGPGGHEVRELRAETPWGFARLDGTMQAAAPFELAVHGFLERREGKASGAARVHPFAAEKIAFLELHAKGINLAAIDPALPRTSLAIDVQARSTPAALLAGAIKTQNAIPGPLDKERVPVSELAARFFLRDSAVRLEDIRAIAAGGEVQGRGTVSADTAQLELGLARIDLRALRSNLRATRLSGTLYADLARAEQRFSGMLTQDGMRLSAEATRRGDEIDVRALRAEAYGGQVTGRGRVRLGEPLFAEGQLQFSRFDPSRFGDFPEGSLSGNAEVRAKAGRARSLAARWTLRESRLAGRPLSSEGSATLTGERLHEVDARARWGASTLTARGAFGAKDDEVRWTLSAPEPLVEAFSAAIQASGTASGTWKSPRVALEARSGPALIGGRVRAQSVTARGSGTLQEHELAANVRGEGYSVEARARGGWKDDAWQGTVLALRNTGRYPLELTAPVALRVAPEAVALGRLDARLGDGRIAVQSVRWRPGRLSTQGEFAGLPAAWLLVAAKQDARLRSTLRLDGEWALESLPELDGRVSLRRASGDLAVLQPAPLELGLRAAQLDARFERGRASAEARIESRLGSVVAKGTAAGLQKDSAIALNAQLEVEDIRALTGELPANVRVRGRASALLDVRGTFAQPEIAGGARGDAISVHYPPYGVYLEDGTVRATLAGDAIRIDALSLRGGEGRFTASGMLPLRADKATSLAWQAERLQLLNRPDLRLVVSGGGLAAIEDRRLGLQGRLLVENGRIERGFERLPNLDDDIVVLGQPEQAPERRARLPLDLDLLVELGERFEVREAGFDGRLKGEVHVSTNAGGDLRAFGRIEAADATFRAYGRNLAVDPGIVIFNGPIRNPTLQITAWRKNQQVEAGVRITGTLEQPRAELVSDPPVPEGAKLSWLVLGRAPSEVGGGADLALLQTAASALLGRGNRDSVPITTRIADAFGLDELSLRGSSDLSSRVIALGKRLSDRIYVSYERSLGAIAENLVKVDLSLTDRISVRAQTGTISGVGVYYRYAWD